MNKRFPYTIIPKYFKTLNDIGNEANIKVIYWRILNFQYSKLIGAVNILIMDLDKELFTL